MHGATIKNWRSLDGRDRETIWGTIPVFFYCMEWGKPRSNLRHGNARSKSLFYIYCFILCLLSHWCAYKNRNQNSGKTAWRYVSVYLDRYFLYVNWVDSNRCRYIASQQTSLHLGLICFTSSIFRRLCYKVSNISYRYQLWKTFSHRDNIELVVFPF